MILFQACKQIVTTRLPGSRMISPRRLEKWSHRVYILAIRNRNNGNEMLRTHLCKYRIFSRLHLAAIFFFRLTRLVASLLIDDRDLRCSTFCFPDYLLVTYSFIVYAVFYGLWSWLFREVLFSFLQWEVK